MYLLALDMNEAMVVKYALTMHAQKLDDDLVTTTDAATADGVWNRLDALDAIVRPSFAEWVRFAGCGPARGRRQG
jgi:hypothetical protein